MFNYDKKVFEYFKSELVVNKDFVFLIYKYRLAFSEVDFDEDT